MPTDLLETHAELDRAVDQAFGVRTDVTVPERQQALFEHYAVLVAAT